MKLRAVFFGFVTHFGGATRSTVEFARHLAEHVHVSVIDVYGSCQPYRDAIEKAGLDYHVLCPESGGQVIGGTGTFGRFFSIAKSLTHLFVVSRRLGKLLVTMEPSLVWCNQFKSASMLGFTPILRKIPLILYLRGWYTPDMMPVYGRWLCRNRAAAIFALSHATKSALICSGIDGRKIHVLHNPIDVDEYVGLSRRPIDGELPQQGRPVRILLPADIIRTKGQHTAVEAMRQILDCGHNAVLWLAGEHAWPQGANRDYLQSTKELARRLGVSDRVEWLGRRDDMPQVMAAATIVVFPSHTEGQGRVLLEAMSLSKPVVACPSGGILDMVCENVTGLLFDINDANGLSDCMCRLITNPDFAARLGQQGQEYIRMTFTPKQQLEKALKVMSSVAGLGNAPSSCGERGNGA